MRRAKSQENLKILIVLIICLLLSVHSLYSQERSLKEMPNILFIFADDLGWGDLSCYGNDRITTSVLDSLASKGTLFTQFYVSASVCSPSRVGIMTGQYPARNRVFGHFTKESINQRRDMPNSLDPDLFTLTDGLKEAGYKTAHFGKWHLGNISPKEYGLDVFNTDSSNSEEGHDPIDIKSPAARQTGTDRILDDTFQFISSNSHGPWYTNVWLYDVHATLNPSEDQLKRVGELKFPTVDFYGVEQVYYASLLEMDKQIGIFLNQLAQEGLLENTMVIFSSDNGPEDFQIRNAAHSGVGSNGPFRGRKRSIYEGGIRVPFIISWPGHVPAGKVNNSSVVNGVDFLPTLAKLANIDPSFVNNLDGEDMSDVWMGSDRKRKRDCFWEWRYDVFGHILNRSPRLAVRSGDYKLLMNPNNSRIELYNIVEDPSELNNLKDVQRSRAEELSEKLLKWNQTLPSSYHDPSAGEAAWKWPG